MTPSRRLTLVSVAILAGFSVASAQEQDLPPAVDYEASSNDIKLAMMYQGNSTTRPPSAVG